MRLESIMRRDLPVMWRDADPRMRRARAQMSWATDPEAWPWGVHAMSPGNVARHVRALRRVRAVV